MEAEVGLFAQQVGADFAEVETEIKEITRSLAYESDQLAKELENINQSERTLEKDREELKSIWAEFLDVPIESVEQAAFEECRRAEDAAEASTKALEQAKRERDQVKALRCSKDAKLRALKEELEQAIRELEELELRRNRSSASLLSRTMRVKVDSNKANCIAMIINHPTKPRKICIIKDSENSENQDLNENTFVDDFWSKVSSLYD